MFAPSNRFYILSPWIFLASGLTAWILSAIGDQIYQTVSLFALVFLLAIPFQLLTLAALPFALVKLWHAGVPNLRRIDLISRVKRTDWTAIAQNGQRIAKPVGTRITSLVTRIASRLRAGVHLIKAHLRGFDWRTARRFTTRLVLNLILTMLPVIVIFAALWVHGTQIPRRNQSVEILIPALIIATPFVCLIGVGLKTWLDLARIFSFTPTFLRGLRIKIMIAAPVLAVIAIILGVMDLSPMDRGWMILLAPMIAVAIMGQACVMALVILAIEKITKRVQTPPPDPHQRWMNDPHRTEQA